MNNWSFLMGFWVKIKSLRIRCFLSPNWTLLLHFWSIHCLKRWMNIVGIADKRTSDHITYYVAIITQFKPCDINQSLISTCCLHQWLWIKEFILCITWNWNLFYVYLNLSAIYFPNKTFFITTSNSDDLVYKPYLLLPKIIASHLWIRDNSF